VGAFEHEIHSKIFGFPARMRFLGETNGKLDFLLEVDWTLGCGRAMIRFKGKGMARASNVKENRTGKGRFGFDPREKNNDIMPGTRDHRRV
jgi:hypothetical protein